MLPGRVFLRSLVASFALGACLVSPQPTPPEEPTLLADLVTPGGPQDQSSFVRFLGEPGAVHPPVGEVRVTNLETTDLPGVGVVAEDGSFDLLVPGAQGDEFRVEVVAPGGQRSQPLDVVKGASDTSFEPGPRPLADCLRVEPAFSLAFEGAGETRDLLVRNDCPDELSFLAPRLRRAAASFAFEPTTPFVLAPGAVETIAVFAGVQGAERDDVFFVETTGAVRDRRPLTLHVLP